MPRHGADRFEGVAVIDDFGIERPHLDAARDDGRVVLAEMMNGEF